MDDELRWKRIFGEPDRTGAHLHVQLRRAIVHAVETNQLGVDVRLPSSRQLASLLGIGRNTVNAAYQQLVDEGLLVARERCGIFVAVSPPSRKPRLVPKAGGADWSARFAMRPSAQPQIVKPRDWLSYPYPFLFGQFDPALFPSNNWRESVRAASHVRQINGWAGDLIDEDDADLVDQLRQHVLPRRGVIASADEIIVTIGSQQALSMLVQLLVGRDTPVGVENPGYTDVRNMVRLTTQDVVNLTVDAHGVVPDSRLAGRKVAFLTVGHQCPTTAVMPLARRRDLLAMAERHDILIVEDDYEADMDFDGGQAIPCLKSLDPSGRVIYVGSFSKALAPGLRVGYIVAPAPVVAELRVLRRLMLRHPPSNNQRSLATFIALGHYRHHLKRCGEVLKTRADLIESLLPALLPDCHWRRDPSATSFWIEAPPGTDMRAIAEQARVEHGVLLEPGDIFFNRPEEARRFFRLGFTAIATHRIETGLRLLAGLMPAHAGRVSRGRKL
ncbi:MocR-like pyridoxine biosynthesis transcription factor PdxR [Aquabacter sp. L1I39]|uniref:MocR-like pyridoxine biosynthesis transcription factor PdxR n=1 Tax=Aquabacter sp. L1I39 TaxID=2820278 RepID=UPI001FFC2F23|nr:PLP-dependent aminotransferase family protein [Aquabacter sp. L1I39]